MKNFKKLIFWESFFIGASIVVWGFTPNNDGILAFTAAFAAAAFAFAFAAFATTFAVAAAAFAVAFAFAFAALALLEKQPLRFLPVVASIAVEFAAIFIVFKYGWPLAAAMGILILFGMRYLPERLVVRLAVADN